MSRMEQLLAFIESSKKDADDFKRKAEQYASEGDDWACSLALQGYWINKKYHEDALNFYKEIAAWSGDSQTA
jgi:hypothetical protein